MHDCINQTSFADFNMSIHYPSQHNWHMITAILIITADIYTQSTMKDYWNLDGVATGLLQ